MRWMGVLVCLGAGLWACGAPAARTAGRAPDAAARREAERPEPEISPDEALRRADELYSSQLAAAGRDQRFAVDRQISALREAVILYDLFLESAVERARTDAKILISIQRTRERIRDAEETIAGLEASAAEAP